MIPDIKPSDVPFQHVTEFMEKLCELFGARWYYEDGKLGLILADGKKLE